MVISCSYPFNIVAYSMQITVQYEQEQRNRFIKAVFIDISNKLAKLIYEHIHRSINEILRTNKSECENVIRSLT